MEGLDVISDKNIYPLMQWFGMEELETLRKLFFVNQKDMELNLYGLSSKCFKGDDAVQYIQKMYIDLWYRLEVAKIMEKPKDKQKNNSKGSQEDEQKDKQDGQTTQAEQQDKKIIQTEQQEEPTAQVLKN